VGRAIVKAVNVLLTSVKVNENSNFDIFHETYYSRIDCCPRSAKRVLTVHDMIHEKFSEMFPKQDKTHKIKASSIKRADHIICVSEATRKDLIEFLGVPSEKTSVVYHGYSLTTDHTVPIPAKINRPYILYVGHRAGYKNFFALLRAYSLSCRLKNDFSIVCFGGENTINTEIAMAISLNISQDKILYLSGSNDILAGLYSSASLFVCPSLYEGFGITTLEAMAFGCPVACSNAGSLPEVVGDAAQLFDPANDEEICTAIEQVVYSPDRNKMLIDQGYQRIKRFSWDKCASDTLDVYYHVLQS
jgi:glycosyltransferase involved in cell wall biosynthesis